MSKRGFQTLLVSAIIAGSMLTACAQHTPKQTLPSASAPASAPATGVTKAGKPGGVGVNGNANDNARASRSPGPTTPNTLPTVPANPVTKAEKPGGGEGGGEGGGGEGGKGAEAPRGPTLTNPGGLPPAPAINDPALAQLGEERMVRVAGPKGQFSILFVDGWRQGPGRGPNSILSTQKKWYAEANVVSANGHTPEQAARALEASRANSASGYHRLALQKGSVHGLPAASLIYEYGAGTNPVTGKPLRFIASEIFIGGGLAGKLGHVTFVAPYAFYGDLTEVFDKILVGFTWQKR